MAWKPLELIRVSVYAANLLLHIHWNLFYLIPFMCRRLLIIPVICLFFVIFRLYHRCFKVSHMIEVRWPFYSFSNYHGSNMKCEFGTKLVELLSSIWHRVKNFPHDNFELDQKILADCKLISRLYNGFGSICEPFHSSTSPVHQAKKFHFSFTHFFLPLFYITLFLSWWCVS